MTTYLDTPRNLQWQADFDESTHPHFLFCRDWADRTHVVQTVHRVFTQLEKECFGAKDPVKGQRYRVVRERLKRAEVPVVEANFRAARDNAWDHPAIEEMRARWEAGGKQDFVGDKQYARIDALVRGIDLLGHEGNESPKIMVGKENIENTSLVAKKAAEKQAALREDREYIPAPKPDRSIADIIDPKGKSGEQIRLPGVELIQWGTENIGRDLMEEECPSPAAFRFLNYINTPPGQQLLWGTLLPKILPTQRDLDRTMKRQRQDRTMLELYDEIMEIADGN